jgi:hypothetical protein
MNMMCHELTPFECEKFLRNLELEAYAAIVSVFCAQGDLTEKKLGVLQQLQVLLRIPVERHRAELRRALNDDRLDFKKLSKQKPNWCDEINNHTSNVIMKRKPPNTVYKTIADEISTKSKTLANKLNDANVPNSPTKPLLNDTTKPSGVKYLKTIPINSPASRTDEISVSITKENQKLIILTNNTKNKKPAVVKLMSDPDFVNLVKPFAVNEIKVKGESVRPASTTKRSHILFKPIVKQQKSTSASPTRHQESVINKVVGDFSFYDDSTNNKTHEIWGVDTTTHVKRIKMFDDIETKT